MGSNNLLDEQAQHISLGFKTKEFNLDWNGLEF